jgi:hypothetical protein
VSLKISVKKSNYLVTTVPIISVGRLIKMTDGIEAHAEKKVRHDKAILR